ncbi:hypothetical protein OOZ15_05640 [Galbibacter sp. EGI 63066]|uniref:XAC2610-related protein n=1 Tax=Galbibacter sp. EGI 63066 TaxID=2993559 RepID=UPI0022493EA7|nr:hypothetical protein [Galbibacter sp. EGI 63066]MCX2679419.1 hypothetical protein [Galbibacter sp. EGI 63066]
MKKYFLIIGFLIALISCKNDNKNSDSGTSTADSLKLKEKEVQISDEELIKNSLRRHNNRLSGNDSVFYKAKIVRPADSAFIAMGLYGKTKRNNSLQEFKETAVIKDNKTVISKIRGTVFRIDKLSNNRYKVYCNDSENAAFKAYNINFNVQPVSFEESEQTANFYFNLLSKKKFVHNIENQKRFFNIRKDKQIIGDVLLDTLSNGQRIYASDGLLNIKNATALNTFYFVSDSSLLHKLIIKDTTRVYTNITLSGIEENAKSRTEHYSEFINDSLFKQTKVVETLSKDSKHVVEYITDSIMTTYSYNKEFKFSLISTDTLTSKETRALYNKSLVDSTFKVHSKSFDINGMDAAWQYSVRYTRKTNADPKTINVSISKRELVTANGHRFIFEAPLSPIKKSVEISSLSQQDFKPADFDINFDGHTDLSFPDGYDLNRNTTFVVYLYNPGQKTFEKNPDFSGPSMAARILLDKDSKTAIYTSQIGQNDYSASILHLGNNGQILFKDIYWSSHSGEKPIIHYQKIQNKAVVEKQDDIAKDVKWNNRDFKNEFLTWVKERIGK